MAERKRIYHERYKGPFEVLIRKTVVEIQFLKLSKYLKTKYGNKITLVKMINTDKMKIICEDKNIANVYRKIKWKLLAK